MSQDITNNTAPVCGGGNAVNEDYNLDLHIGSFFIILVTSTLGASFSLLAKVHSRITLPSWTPFIIKHFGTGVITATAFIHMLPSAFSALNDPCLPEVWTTTYSAFPGAFAMISMFTIFFVEYFAIKVLDQGTVDNSSPDKKKSIVHLENASPEPDHLAHFGHEHTFDRETMMNSKAQILGITILEVGICFHSIIIGMALSVSNGSDFISLLCALVFHQTFEGLGLGSRIAELKFKEKSLKPWLMALAYGLTTPFGIAIGLGVRNTYDPNSQTALIVEGILDSISAGLLLYSAMVELLANDFIYDRSFRKSSNLNQFGAFFLLLSGAGLMALIGRWA